MKNYIFTAILVFISILAHSQYKDWCSSEIFLKDGTKLSGKARLTMIESKFGFPIPIVSEEYLRYINFKIKQKKSTEFTPQEVEKIIFELDYKEKGKRVKRQATYIPIIKSENKNKLGFAELIIDGTVKLVKRTVSNSNRNSVFEESLLMRNNEEAIIFNYVELKSFKKRASEYFSDCSSLVSKIEDEKYNRKDLEDLVNYYNANCAK
uniref:hypothetical protein n=1 Tax=Mariniflexile sp. TaxID=1979402 RepID=UPI00404753FD